MNRGVVWGLVAGGVVIGLVVVFVLTRPVERFVYGALALSADEALLATRWNDDASRWFIELVGPSELRWEVETTPLELPSTLGVVAAAADEGAVYVALVGVDGASAEVVEVVAFDRATGARRWASRLPAPRERYRMAYAEPVQVAQGKVLVLVEDGGLVLHALDLASGALAWQARLGDRQVSAFEVGPARALVLGEAARTVALADGAVSEPVASRGGGCRHGERVLVAAEAGFREVALDEGRDEAFVVPGAIRWMEACAKSGDGWVVVGRTEDTLVAQGIGRGAVRWTTPLPGTGLSTLGGPGRGDVQGGGEVAGVWPLVVYGTDAVGGQVERLVPLEVATGHIASEREGEHAGGLRLPGITPAEGRTLVGSRLGAVSLLGANGEVLRTVRAEGLDLVPGHAAGGRLWLVQTHAFALAGAHARTLVDLATGDAVGGVGQAFEVDGRGLDASFPRRGWYRLRPDGEGFEVALPAEPRREVKKVSGAQGHTVDLVQYDYNDEDIALIVSVSPLIEQLVEHGDVQLALDRTLAGQTDLPGRRVKSKQVITFQGFPGREAVLDMDLEEGLEATLRLRMVMVGLRMHMQLAIWARGPEPASVARFFDSFGLVGEPVREAGVDLWQRFEIPELGVSVELPRRPHFDRLHQRTVFGEAMVARADADSSFPPASYGLQRLSLPKELEGAAPDAVIAAWERGLFGGEGPKLEVVERAAAEVGGRPALRLRVREVPGREGVGDAWYLAIPRDGALLVLTMQSLGPAAGEVEAGRFLGSLRAP